MQLIEAFITYLSSERNFSEKTITAYRSDLYDFLEYIGIAEADFQPETIEERLVRAWVVNQMGRGCTARTVRRRLSALHSFWKFLLRTNQVTHNPTTRIVTPKLDKPLPVFFKDSEIQAALQLGQEADDFVSIRNSLIIQILYETGIRRAELQSLQVKDINFAANELRVFGKRRKERLVPFGQSLADDLRRYIDMRTCETEADANGALWVHEDGRPVTYAQIYTIVKERMGEVSTLKKQSPHVLRHTFATTLLDNGADINSIKKLMGHANLAATQIYTHTTFDQIRQVYKDAHPRAKKD